VSCVRWFVDAEAARAARGYVQKREAVRYALHCLVLDGVYRNSTAAFHEVAAPTLEELQALLAKIITRLMRLLTKHGFLIEEQDRTYLAEIDKESALIAPASGNGHIFRKVQEGIGQFHSLLWPTKL
jgi:hypothetical protein